MAPAFGDLFIQGIKNADTAAKGSDAILNLTNTFKALSAESGSMKTLVKNLIKTPENLGSMANIFKKMDVDSLSLIHI